jgi:hypothetical protein
MLHGTHFRKQQLGDLGEHAAVFAMAQAFRLVHGDSD